jgi:hypothetical protein
MAISLRLCLLIAGAIFSAGSAFAQAATPETPTAPGQNLSKKLDQSNGVIHPKEWTRPSRSRPQNGRFERGAAARDFRRRSRSAAKMNALSR